MANNNHATKADLNTLRTELKGDMATLRTELKGDMATLRNELKGDMVVLRDELTEVIRDTETKLLKAFYGYAETTEKRLSEGERATVGLADRLAILERRMTDLEKRVNFPQAS